MTDHTETVFTTIAESKSDPKTETKPELKVDLKSETKTEMKSETKTDPNDILKDFPSSSSLRSSFSSLKSSEAEILRRKKEEKYLLRVSEASIIYMKQLSDSALAAITKMKDTNANYVYTYFDINPDFKTIDGFKHSTFVTGWWNQRGIHDISIFKKIKYETTPFDHLKNLLVEKGYFLEYMPKGKNYKIEIRD